MTRICHVQRIDRKNFEFLKIQDGGGHHLEKSQQSRYFRNGLTDRYDIWQADAK